MRVFVLLLSSLWLASVAVADQGDGAVRAIEEAARSACGHTAATVDPIGLTQALNAGLGASFGLHDDSTQIGRFFQDDPYIGAQYWARDMLSHPQGCELLITLLSQSASASVMEFLQ